MRWDLPVPSPHGWMIGFLERGAAHNQFGLRTHRLLYHSLLLPFAALPQVRRLCCWIHLHSVWRHGSRCQPVSLAHVHNSTRLRDSVRQATSQVQQHSRDVGVSPERPCLARGDCCPPGKGCNRAGPSSRDEAGVLQPLLHRTQERW